MATKEVQLTIGERVEALKMFDMFKGALSAMAAVLDDVKAIAISGEDWTAANMKKTNPDEKGNYSMTWDDEGSEKTIPMSQEGVDYLLGKIKEKSEAGEFTIADKAVITLEAKLK